MGQKVHPYGFRLGVIKTWNSKWFEDKSYAKWLHEDIRIKRAVKSYLQNAGIAGVEIERTAGRQHRRRVRATHRKGALAVADVDQRVWQVCERRCERGRQRRAVGLGS